MVRSTPRALVRVAHFVVGRGYGRIPLLANWQRRIQQRTDLTHSANDLGLTKDGKPYLSRLLYTRNEADAVMAVTPPGKGMLALDFEASRSVATSPALAKYRIVHFATHGILDNKHPELSGLVLSLVNKDGKAQDEEGAMTVLLRLASRLHDFGKASGRNKLCRTWQSRQFQSRALRNRAPTCLSEGSGFTHWNERRQKPKR